MTDTSLDKMAFLYKEAYSPNPGDDLPYIGLEHIEQQTLQLSGIGTSDSVISGKSRFYTGDILFGKLRPYFRKVYRPKFDGVCSTDIWVVRAKPGFDQGFLFYFLANKEFIDLTSQGSTGTRMPRADWSLLKSVEFEVPDYTTQQRIAAILSSLDDKIELNRQMNQTLEEMAQAMFKHYFVDGIDKENLPDGWRMGKLENILSLEYGKTLLEKNRISGVYPVVGSGGIIGTHSAYFINGPGIVVGRKGNAGAVSWIDEDFYPIDTTFYVVDKSDYDGMYFHYYLLKSLNLKDYNSDSAVPGLNRNQAHNTDVALPPKSLAKCFNVECQPLFDGIKCNTDEISILTQTRDYLLPKLISGEIIPAELKEIEQAL